MDDQELTHYGVKGMKWGVRKKNRSYSPSYHGYPSWYKKRVAKKERQALIDDSKNIHRRAEPGKHLMVPGKYSQSSWGRYYPAMHIVNDAGKVKFSYILGRDGARAIAAGKEYMSKVNLKQFFRGINPKTDIDIEYDVYD